MEQVEQMYEAGMDDVVTKPFKIDGLMAHLTDLIRRRRSSLDDGRG